MFKMNNYQFFKNILLIKNYLKLQLKSFCCDTIQEHRAKLLAKNLPKQKPITGVKHIILVSSGKGGVGKSTISVNLAIALKNTNPNKNIGLLDTDVFGPSIPLMMNLHDTPILNKDNKMEPLMNYGVKCMSMGFLIEENAPLIWRGLMVMQALEKLLRQVYWDDIDYLIVDTPPGTGDTHLSLVQNLPISGVLLVTTPQKAAVQVTKRGASMYKKLNVPLIGIVENMSYIKCPSCAYNVKIFGEETRKFADEFNLNILQSFPIEQKFSDNKPIVISEANCDESNSYKNLSGQIIQYLKNR